MGKYLFPLGKFFRKRTNRVICVVSVGVAIIGALLLVMIGNLAERTLIEQAYNRGRLISRSGVQTIESLFGQLESSFKLLAQNPLVTSKSADAQQILQEFVDRSEQFALAGVIIADANGIVEFNANRTRTSDIGADISDRDYFSWAMEARAGDIYYGDVVPSRLGATEGRLIITMSIPIVVDTNFNGVMTAAFLVSELGDKITAPLSIFPGTQVWLFNQSGTMLYAPKEEFYGQNIYEILSRTPFPGSDKVKLLLDRTLKGSSTGTFDMFVPDFTTGALKRFLITYAPIEFGRVHWTVAVMIPMELVKDSLVPLQRNFTLYYVLVIAVVLIFSGLLIVEIRLVYRDAYERGYTDGRGYERQKRKPTGKN